MSRDCPTGPFVQESFALYSRFPELRPHLPETERLTAVPRLSAMIERHGAVVLKLRRGFGGHGLVRVDRTSGGFYVSDKDSAQEWYCSDPAANPAVAACLRNPGRYLVQQRIDVPEYKGRLVDFRAVMQKDGSGVWASRGWFGRFGQLGLPTSKAGENGYRHPGEESVVRAFGCGREHARELGHRILQLVRAACDALDRTGGCYGDVSVDIAVDSRRHPWLLEVNKLHNPLSPVRCGDVQGYMDIRSGPLLYASYLAGFPVP